MARGPDGIKIIYGSNRSNAQSWYFQGSQDARMKIGASRGIFSKNMDGSYSLSQNSDVYLAIETNDKSGVIGTDQKTASARGFMRNPRDWKNIEVHGYFFADPASSPDAVITISCHGGDPYSTYNNRCLGIGYQFSVFKSGSARFGKALWYPTGHLYTTPKSILTDLGGRWIGFKLVCIVLGPGKVKLETFVDEGNITNNWKPLDTITDSGGWGGQGLSLDPEEATSNVCNGSTDHILDMGGPIVSFAWSGFSAGMKIKNLAIREITAKASYTDLAVRRPSVFGSQNPKYGIQPQNDSQFYPDSENFQTEDPVTNP